MGSRHGHRPTRARGGVKATRESDPASPAEASDGEGETVGAVGGEPGGSDGAAKERGT